MADFVTISLESNECDICNQDNGEELISYILNDRCLRQQKLWSRKSETTDDQVRRAHLLCLDRWDHIMKKSLNRFNLLRRSWTGKQSRSLTKAESSSLENLNISHTWTPVKTHSQEKLYSNSSTVSQSPQPKRTDVGLRPLATTVQMKSRKAEHGGCRDFEVKLARSSVKDLHRRISCYNKKIKDASTQLIALLQERDALRQEAEVRRVAIEQLLKLQTGARRSPSVVGKTGLDTSQRNSLPV